MSLRFGNITEIDVTNMYARVTFLDDGIVSAPLQILTMGALGNKYFHMFDINEQVACMMDDESVEGVILGAIFNNNTNPDGGNKDVVRVKFSDNSVIEYNRATHEYNLDIKGKINIKADSEVNIDATVVNVDAETVNVDASTIGITGTTTITGNLIVAGNATVSGTVTGSTAISTPALSGPGITMSGGNMVADGEVKGATVVAGTIDLATHVHSGVTTGGGSTAPPTP